MSSKNTIGRKLVLLVLCSLAASFVTTAVLSTIIETRRQVDLEAERLTQTARVIGSLSAEAVRVGDRRGAFEGVRSIRQMPDVTYARIETPDGRVLAETGGGLRLARDAQVRDGERPSLWSVLTTGSLQARAPVISRGETVGEIVLFSRAPEVRERILFALWISLAGAGVALLAGLAVAMRLSRRISAPIGALAAHMEQVQATHDYRRSADIRADGEVAELVRGFNAMLAGIRERDTRIAIQVETLEDQVAERTADLREAKEAAESANAAKSDFLAVMSHEIRTPLNGILALSDMLARADLPSRQRRHADVIAKSGRSLLGVINDILDFSKVEAGKMDLEAVPVDAGEIAEDVASLFQERAGAKGLDLAVYADPRLPQVIADPVRLRQVISNLVNNAIKFTDQGGVLIRVEADPLAPDRLLIAVEDTGPGIPPDRLPTVFEAFTQADQSTTRRYGGTGLGLAICDRIVRVMAGEWRLESEVGRGSCFAFSAALPFAETAASPAPDLSMLTAATHGLGPMSERSLTLYLDALRVARSGIEQAQLVFAAGRPPGAAHPIVAVLEGADEHGADVVLPRPLRRADLVTVLQQVSQGRTPVLESGVSGARQHLPTFPGVRALVVDDSDVNREVAAEALDQLGLQVTLVDSGEAAIDLMRSQSFDLVFMDGSMPGLDGFETARRIRAEEAELGKIRTPILALTAHVIGSGADAWRKAGMEGVVHKPFTVTDLAAALRTILPDRHESDVSVGRGPDIEAGEEGIFDPQARAELKAIAARRPEFLQRVQGLYRDNAPLRAAEIDAALAAGDMEALARAAHALKSMSLSIGARAVAAAATAVESGACKARVGLVRDVEGLHDALTRTLKALSEDSAQEKSSRSAVLSLPVSEPAPIS